MVMNEILEIIEQDPKIDPAEIARLIGQSETEVRSHIKELEDSGIIRKYKAVIDWDKVGEEYLYAIIELKITLGDRSGYDEIARRIANFNEKISTLDQVQSTVTHFVLKTYKEDGVTLFEKEKSKRLAITP